MSTTDTFIQRNILATEVAEYINKRVKLIGYNTIDNDVELLKFKDNIDTFISFTFVIGNRESWNERINTFMNTIINILEAPVSQLKRDTSSTTNFLKYHPNNYYFQLLRGKKDDGREIDINIYRSKIVTE